MNRSNRPAEASRSLDALSDAAAWRLAGLLLERPRPGWHGEVKALSREVKDPALQVAAAASREAAEGAYLRLLGPGGALSPREVAYRAKEDPGRVLADIAGFYRAFSFSPRAEDPIDHVSVETNFAAYLCLKVAYALREGNREDAETTSRALHLFAEEHLGPFAGAFAARLEELEDAVEGSESPYLAQAARSLQDLAHKSREQI